MPEHSVITDPNIHEPKGVSSATADKAYFANGSGSGSWKKIYTMGWEDYNDSGSTQNLTNGVWSDITNDGAGAYTNTAYKLPGYANIWDTVNNQFDWATAGLKIGDVVGIRFDIEVNVNSANDNVALALDMAHGHASEFKLWLDNSNYDVAGTHRLLRYTELYIGSNEILNNPAKVTMTADSAGDSVIVYGWFVKVLPRNPVLS